MGFPNGTLRRLESANKAIADELPVLHSRSAIIGDPDSLLWVKTRIYRAAALLSASPSISRPRQEGFNTTLCAITGCEQSQQNGPLFNQFVSTGKQLNWGIEAQCSGRFQVDH